MARPAFDRFCAREEPAQVQASGEGTNLFLAIDEFGLDDDSFDRLEPLFDDYELALHQSLVSRDRYLETSAPKLYAQEGDEEKARDVVSRQVEYRKAVRDVNDQYITTFAAEVREVTKTGNASPGLMRAYEDIYRPRGPTSRRSAGTGARGDQTRCSSWPPATSPMQAR